MKVSNDLIIWLFIFLLIALILGLYQAENHRIPNSLFMRTGGSTTPYLEHFGNADNHYYEIENNDYGIEDDDYERANFRQEYRKKVCPHPDKPPSDPLNKDHPECFRDDIYKIRHEICRRCDILAHPDIDKYVLKSSVPPCPNPQEYIRKNEIPGCPDLSNYILKSEIPSCQNVNLQDYVKRSDVNQLIQSEYIKKSDLPKYVEEELKKSSPIPKCPLCPTIPSDLLTKKSGFDLKGATPQEIEMILQDQRIRQYLDAHYVEKEFTNPNPIASKSSLSTGGMVSLPNGMVSSPSSNHSYESSFSLWDEIKSFFGFKSSSSEINLQQEEEMIPSLKNHNVPSAEELNLKTTPNSNQMKETNSTMIYNQNLAMNENSTFAKNQMLNPIVSNADAQYAGDNLFATVNFS